MIAALNRKYVLWGKALRLGIIHLGERGSEGSTPSIGFLDVHNKGGGSQLSPSPQRPGPVPGCMRSVVYTQGGTS